MKTKINLVGGRSQPLMDKKLGKGSLSSLNRSLIHKKFVNSKMLAFIFLGTLLYLFFYSSLIEDTPYYLVLLSVAPMLLLVWNKLYQVVYDLKILFYFDESYDTGVEFPDGQEYPTITFIIASYQEPFSVAKMTFDSVINTPYKGRKEIIVADNSKDILSDDFIKWKKYVENAANLYIGHDVSAKFLYNEMTHTLKPGNLDLAQKFIEEGEYVVFLDVDSTLQEEGNLLERAVAEFTTDEKLGLLQFNMKATNNNFNDLAQAVAASQDLWRLRMASRSYGGYKIFEGHNGMWRKSVLEKVGPWTDYYKGNIMITEDAIKSAQMYAEGYYGKSLYVETGEWVPSSLKALESMWMRWTYGTTQVMLKYFKDLYSKRVSLVEKFDVTFHILHHLAIASIFPIAFFLQLFVPGSITNVFIISIYVIPQLIGAITSYFSSLNKLEAPIIKKLQHAYSGFFPVETFIIMTQLKSDINFMLGKPQGWKVTEKGVENSMSWKDLIINKSFHLGMAFFALVVCVVSWTINYKMDFSSLFHFSGLIFMNVNLVLCILAFGKQGRKAHNEVQSQVIDRDSLEEILESKVNSYA